VVLNNGRIHYLGNCEIWSRDHCDKEGSGSYTIRGHKVISIASGDFHGIMVTMRGAVIGFGSNNDHQLGVGDPSTLSDDIVLTPTEVFAAVTNFKGVVRLPDGKEL
jgi:alpha-tubulin suppressor-like RCC1 family protein